MVECLPTVFEALGSIFIFFLFFSHEASGSCLHVRLNLLVSSFRVLACLQREETWEKCRCVAQDILGHDGEIRLCPQVAASLEGSWTTNKNRELGSRQRQLLSI